MKVRAHAALSPKGPLEPFEYDPGPLGPQQVDVRVTHCGICHTDSAMVDNDYGFTQYPLVPGHEAVGVVAAVGTEVNRLRVGQRVGVGPMCGSCMQCEWCESGLQHLCPNVRLTIVGGHQGGFATHVRVDNWQFAFPLPDEITSEHAGPLMCAGATVFTPILQYGVRPTDRVAVVGVGGLGHLAVQYLAKWGCDVTAVSSSRDKEAHARQLGARHYEAAANIEVLPRTEITRLSGGPGSHLARVRWRRATTGGETELPICHLFLFVGVEPATAWLRDCGIALDPEGFVRTGTDEHTPRPLPLESSIPGVFAVGDVRAGSAKRVGAAIGEGAAVVAQLHTVLADAPTVRR